MRSEAPAGVLVSVIVTTRNEAGDIQRCLTSLRRQSTPVEIIVVDNNSSDGTWQLAASGADLVLTFGPERSAQRNEGARHARGKFLFFVDADMELEAEVVSEALAAASKGAGAVVVPEVSVGAGIWSAAKALERSCYVGDDTVEAARFFARDAFFRHGGYDESLTGPEDWDLPGRMRSTETIARTSAAIIHHEGALTLAELVRKKFYYGRSFLSYMRRHPSLASKQLTVIRPAFIRHWRRLARSPGLTTVMVVMKIAEFGAGGVGLTASVVQLWAHGVVRQIRLWSRRGDVSR